MILIVQRLPEARDSLANNVLGRIKLDLQTYALLRQGGGPKRALQEIITPITHHVPHSSLGVPVLDWFIGQRLLVENVADCLESLALVIFRDNALPQNLQQTRYSSVWFLYDHFIASLTYLKVLMWIEQNQ